MECAQVLCGVWCCITYTSVFFIEQGNDVSDLTVARKRFVFRKVLGVVFKYVLNCLSLFGIIHVITFFADNKK